MRQTSIDQFVDQSAHQLFATQNLVREKLIFIYYAQTTAQYHMGTPS